MPPPPPPPTFTTKRAEGGGVAEGVGVVPGGVVLREPILGVLRFATRRATITSAWSEAKLPPRIKK